MARDLAELESLVVDLGKEVTRLSDLREIEQLIVSYARGCDRGNDPGLLAPLFSEQATWECAGFGKYQGRDHLAAALRGIAGEKIWWSLHYMIGPKIDLAPKGMKATVSWYLWESATIPSPTTNDAEAHWIGAIYDCDVEKISGHWLFTRMELILKMASPYSEGWVTQRFPLGTKLQPYFVTLESGTYYWCSCGRSARQPFCDGSHKATSRVPVEFQVAASADVVLCGCKMSRTGHLCDGSHLNLKLAASGRLSVASDA